MFDLTTEPSLGTADLNRQGTRVSSVKREPLSCQQAPKSICIVGTGFRGLGVLERIVAYSRKYEVAIRVHLVDPASQGPKQYDTSQPDYLLLNIVCGQVSMFPDVASVSDGPLAPGPSLYQWVRERGLLMGNDGMTVGSCGRTIEPDDFLPRRLLGEYLLWFQKLLVDQACASLDIVEHRANAIDLTTSNGQMVVRLCDGTSIETDYLFLAVGQIPEPTLEPSTRNRHANARRIARPYPLPDQVNSIAPGETVAIAGLGLSAMDAILSLTIGRGGRVETRDGLDCYIPSGREPRIVAFSRSGLPYRSRPSLGAPLNYDPIVFTPGSINALRADRPKLDYDSDVLPLLFTELRVAYWRAKFGRDRGWDEAQSLLNEFRKAFVEGRLELYLKSLEANDASFDPRLAYFGALPIGDSGLDVLKDGVSYQRWVQKWLEDDLQEARIGVSHSPLKAALEACREFRDVIRYAVEFGGLTDESADRFFSIHAETINRLVVGPQKERTADMLALIRAGVLSVSLGPNPTVDWDESRRQWTLSSSSLGARYETSANWLYMGVTNRLQQLTDDSYIVGAMARSGLLRRFRPNSSVSFGVDVDRSFHPISKSGVASERIWIMGLLCEGVTFYNGYVTSPGRFIRSQYDADRAVRQIFLSH